MTQKLKIACGHCDFTTDSPEEAVSHMFSTGHGRPPGMLEDAQESSLYADLVEGLTKAQEGQGELAEDLPQDVLDSFEQIQQRHLFAEKIIGKLEHPTKPYHAQLIVNDNRPKTLLVRVLAKGRFYPPLAERVLDLSGSVVNDIELFEEMIMQTLAELVQEIEAPKH